jgi:tetratricopeptide (TPR) repeat protein
VIPQTIELATGAAIGPPSPRRSRRAGVPPVILSLLLLLGAGTPGWGQAAADPDLRLPELPPVALDNLLPTVRSAIQQALDKVKAAPLDPAANGKLGMVLQAHNFLPEAEVCYRRARLLDPGAFPWAYYLAHVQVAQANCNDGVPSVRKALELKPDYLPAQLMLGRCLLATGETEEARTLFEAIVREHPENAEAHYGLGRVRAAADEVELAIQSFQKAYELFPEFGPAHFAAARAYYRLGNKQQAEKEVALSKQNKDRFPETEDPLLDEVVDLYRDYEDFLKLAGELRKEGKLEDAATTYEAALRIHPQLYQAHLWLMHLYGRLGQAAKAEEHYRAAVALEPDNAETYFWYGLFSMGQGKTAEAEQAFRKVLGINARYVEARINLGYLLEGQGRLAEAIAELRGALEQKPDSPQAHFSLGRMLVKQEDFEQGIPHLLKALDAADGEARISYLHAVGVAYAGAGDLDNALRYLRRARQLAAAGSHTKLVESIDEDLRLLEGAADPPRSG